jgi:hypothetical protein
VDIREQFIKNTSLTLNIPEDIVDKVIRYQWKSVKEATLTASSLEISGLGRLSVRPSRLVEYRTRFASYLSAAERKLEELDKEDPKWYAAYKTRNGILKDMSFLEQKSINKNLKQYDNGSQQNSECL